MGNVHPHRMEEGFGQLKNKRFEAFTWHRENTHKTFKITRRNGPFIFTMGFAVPVGLAYLSIYGFNDARGGALRMMHEIEPRLYGRGANQKFEWYFPTERDLERERTDPRLRPHVFRPTPADYEPAASHGDDAGKESTKEATH